MVSFPLEYLNQIPCDSLLSTFYLSSSQSWKMPILVVIFICIHRHNGWINQTLVNIF